MSAHPLRPVKHEQPTQPSTPGPRLLELEQRARVFETTLSAIADFAYVFDRDGRFSYVNKALLDLWGIELEEAIGRNFFDLRYPAELATKLQRQIQEVFNTTRRLKDETPYTSPTGVSGYYEYIFIPVIGTNGEVEAVAGSTRDISDRKRAEDELREVHTRLEAAIAAGSVATVTWHIHDDVMVADERLAEIFGIELDQAASLPIARYLAAIHPDDRERVERELDRVLATGDPYEIDYRVTGRGGMVRWVQVRGRLEWDAAGQPLRMAAALIDMTDHKHAEAELETALRAREQFLLIASHELRNPIATVYGTAQLLGRALRDGSLDADRLERYVAVLEATGGQLARLTDDLLDVSRLQHGNVDFRLRRRDIASAVRALVDREPWAQHHVTCEGSLDGLYADIDIDRFEQVVSNLLDNAVKYSPDGAPIAVTLLSNPDVVVVEVADAGVGLPPGAEEQIFKPFGRLDNAAESRIPGLGLGLYLSREIAQRHGGSLSAHSDGPGRGTKMMLRLPAASHPPADRA